MVSIRIRIRCLSAYGYGVYPHRGTVSIRIGVQCLSTYGYGVYPYRDTLHGLWRSIRRGLHEAKEAREGNRTLKSAYELAQGVAGNALCCSKRIRTKSQRGVIRYISFAYALSGLSGLNDIVRPRFVGRCPTLLIALFQSLLHLQTTTGQAAGLLGGIHI
jgi:hypothetical protein